MHKGAAEGGAAPDARQALARMLGTHYTALLRLAALLTGDTALAEAIVAASFAAVRRPRAGIRIGGRAAAGQLSGGQATGCPASGGATGNNVAGGGAAGSGATGNKVAGGGATGNNVAGGGAAGSGAVESGALTALRRQVVMRSRHAERYRGRAAAPPPAFADSAVMRALGALRTAEREAVVLTLYLDLTEEQAAAVTGLGLAEMHRTLARGLHALRAQLSADTW